MKCTIYTDGACSNNPGPGGWAFYLHTESVKKTISGFEKETTNNRMELIATIKALEYSYAEDFTEIHLYTDSKYVMQGITLWCKSWLKNNWMTASKKPVKNKDLWQQLLNLTSVKTAKINWFWVKGHSGDIGNEIADQAARDAITKHV